MKRFLKLVAGVSLLFGMTGSPRATVVSDPPTRAWEVSNIFLGAPLACDPDGQQASGAFYRICMPSFPPWNGDLMVYAHGYVSPTEPVGIPEDQMTLPNGTSIPAAVNLLGFAFATTSYSVNGLAIHEGIADLVDLVNIFTADKGEPDKVYLIGVSEGGVITTLAVEQYPDLFDGGLALCGPYGDFVAQINYWGDFRVLFDYFFPGLIPGSPVDIPVELMVTWDTVYETAIRPVIQDPANAVEVRQLLNVAGAAYDVSDASTRESTIRELLWYNIFATGDGIAKLGGQPFDNQDRVYTGSEDDLLLNSSVSRFSADPAAVDEIAAHYESSGQLGVPLVTGHTTGDPIIPYWHAVRYRGKTILADNIALHEHLKVERYGHCNFTSTEVINAVFRLQQMVENPPPYRAVNRLYVPSLAAAP